MELRYSPQTKFFFYPRSPCGERQGILFTSRHFTYFLSTLSLRRATKPCTRLSGRNTFSIHALLAESDSLQALRRPWLQLFLSTLSLRRATWKDAAGPYQQRVFYPRSPCGERPCRAACPAKFCIFYPRSPCGERRIQPQAADALQVFSIHALLAESDSQHEKINSTNYKFSIHALLAESDTNRKQMAVSVIDFLSTLSLRRATNSIAILFGSLIFLSTLSLRRATF